jgi:hypothetical protein
MKPWHRKLWGVEFSSGSDDRRLIGSAWARFSGFPGHHPGDPTRALLFTTRNAARAWCKAETDHYRHRPDSLNWRFRPVRVIERVDKVKE